MSSCMKVPKASIPNVSPTVQLRASGTGTALAQVIYFFSFLVYFPQKQSRFHARSTRRKMLFKGHVFFFSRNLISKVEYQNLICTLIHEILSLVTL